MGPWFTWMLAFLSLPITSIEGVQVTLGGAAGVMLVAMVGVGVAAMLIRAALSRS